MSLTISPFASGAAAPLAASPVSGAAASVQYDSAIARLLLALHAPDAEGRPAALQGRGSSLLQRLTNWLMGSGEAEADEEGDLERAALAPCVTDYDAAASSDLDQKRVVHCQNVTISRSPVVSQPFCITVNYQLQGSLLATDEMAQGLLSDRVGWCLQQTLPAVFHEIQRQLPQRAGPALCQANIPFSGLFDEEVGGNITAVVVATTDGLTPLSFLRVADAVFNNRRSPFYNRTGGCVKLIEPLVAAYVAEQQKQRQGLMVLVGATSALVICLSSAAAYLVKLKREQLASARTHDGQLPV